MLSGVTATGWSLSLILAFQALLSWMLLQNTAFQDEALYIYAGQQIWRSWLGGPPVTDSYSYTFSGYPYIYPIIGGGLNMIGGIELVRAFSLLCMLVVTACGYYVTKELFNQRSAVFAAIFFVCQGPVLFLSRLSTYDPFCFCMLALGTVVAVKASQARRPWRVLCVSPFLVLAFGAKYGGLLFIPSIIAMLALCTLTRWGWRSMLLRVLLCIFSLSVLGGLAAALVLHFDPKMVHGLNATTINRMVIEVYSRWGLVEHVIGMVGLSYVVGFAGLAFARKKNLLVVLLLLGSSLLIPAYHIYKTELISLDKHLGFSMFFLMPVAGYALASFSDIRGIFVSGRYWLSSVAICLVLFLIGGQEARDMYSTWPATDQLAQVLATQVRLAGGRYLAEQFEVSRYNLRDDTYTWQWTGLDFFEYTDKQGHYYFDREAYVHAVNDGYFNLIQLNYGYNNLQNSTVIVNAIKNSKKYVLIDKIPYQDFYGTGYFWIWRKI
jgi:hypothetical protein